MLHAGSVHACNEYVEIESLYKAALVVGVGLATEVEDGAAGSNTTRQS